jgi:hypothetical protein
MHIFEIIIFFFMNMNEYHFIIISINFHYPIELSGSFVNTARTCYFFFGFARFYGIYKKN